MRKPTQTNAIRAILIYLSQPLLHDIEMSRKKCPNGLGECSELFQSFKIIFSDALCKVHHKNCFRHFPVNLFSFFFAAQISSDRARHFALSRFTNISTICFMANRHHNFGFFISCLCLAREKNFIFILQHFSVWSVNVRHLMLNYSFLFKAFV